MKVKYLVAVALAAATSLASAGEYSCEVYCVGPSGKTTATVSASSSSEAAKKVDNAGDKICRDAGHSKATSSTVGTSQCNKM